MNKQLKFRAFWHKNKTMHEVVSFSERDQSIEVVRISPHAEPSVVSADLCEFTIQQFTGGLDSNKREIYEGDIIEIDEYSTPNPFGGMKFTQRFNNAVVLWDHSSIAYVYGLPRGKDSHMLLIHQLLHLGRNIKVLGNIFENKNLLEKK